MFIILLYSGIDIDELTTEEGYRKKDQIVVSTSRSKTAGMLYAIRTCGIAVGHVELIHAGIKLCIIIHLLHI